MSDEGPVDPFSKHVKPPEGGLPPLRPDDPASEAKAPANHKRRLILSLLALGLLVSVSALALVSVLVIQPAALGVADEDRVAALEQRVSNLERRADRAPSVSELRGEIAKIRRGPRGQRGPRGGVGPPGPPGTVDGYDLDDFESRISELEFADFDSRLTNLETGVSELESFQSGLCSSFLSSDVEPITDIYYFGPC